MKGCDILFIVLFCPLLLFSKVIASPRSLLLDVMHLLMYFVPSTVPQLIDHKMISLQLLSFLKLQITNFWEKYVELYSYLSKNGLRRRFKARFDVYKLIKTFIFAITDILVK